MMKEVALVVGAAGMIVFGLLGYDDLALAFAVLEVLLCLLLIMKGTDD